MVKTKGGRTLNPADAFRKEQRKKEVARNKIERKFIREGARLRSEPEVLKKELQEVIDIEEAQGTLPKNLKLKKKALQEAYDQAIKRKKASSIRGGWGVRGRDWVVAGWRGVVKTGCTRGVQPRVFPARRHLPTPTQQL